MTDLTREGLVELAAKVEHASGPDRELDAAIGCAVAGYYLAKPRYPGAKRMYGYVDGEGSRVEPGNGSADSLIPRYTASLDAAMKLIPDSADAAGERFRLEAYNSPGILAPHVRASAWVAGAPRCYAANEALALCAASLTARARAMEAGRG